MDIRQLQGDSEINFDICFYFHTISALIRNNHCCYVVKAQEKEEAQDSLIPRKDRYVQWKQDHPGEKEERQARACRKLSGQAESDKMKIEAAHHRLRDGTSRYVSWKHPKVQEVVIEPER